MFLFSSPSETFNMLVLVELVPTHRYLRLFIVLNFFLLFLKLDNLNQLTYLQVYRFSWQFVFWALLVNFSFQLIHFATPEFLFNSCFIISTSLLIFSICWDVIVTLSFNSLEIHFLRSLNIVVTADSKFWYSKSNILLGTSTITVDLFFYIWPIFSCFSAHHAIFLLKTGHLNIVWPCWKSDSCS